MVTIDEPLSKTSQKHITFTETSQRLLMNFFEASQKPLNNISQQPFKNLSDNSQSLHNLILSRTFQTLLRGFETSQGTSQQPSSFSDFSEKVLKDFSETSHELVHAITSACQKHTEAHSNSKAAGKGKSNKIWNM